MILTAGWGRETRNINQLYEEEARNNNEKKKQLDFCQMQNMKISNILDFKNEKKCTNTCDHYLYEK